MAIQSSYNKVNWTPRVTPLTASNFKKMDEGIDNLYSLLFPNISEEDRVLIMPKNESIPSWMNLVRFMNSPMGQNYHYDGTLEGNGNNNS